MSSAAIKPNLSKVMAAINKSFGEGTIQVASRVAFSHLRRNSTGVFNLDLGTGGGFPKGRIVGLVGDESVGKTTLCLMFTAQLQHTCRQCNEPFGWYTKTEIDPDTGVETSREFVLTEDCPCSANEPHTVLLVDAEGSFDPLWAARLGVDVPALIIVQPEMGEQAVDIVNATIRSGDLDALIFDSIAQATVRDEIEDSSEKQKVGVHARLMNRMFRTVQSGLNSLGMDNPHKPTVIYVNQFREKIGVMYGDPTTWPGGKGQNFAYSILITMRAGKALDSKGNVRDQFKKGEEKFGREIHWHVKKNKTAVPDKKGTFKFFYAATPEAPYRAGEVNNFEQIVDYGVALGVIEKSGAWYDLQAGFGEEYGNPSVKTGKFQGMESLVEFLQVEPKRVKAVREKILHAARLLDTGEEV